MQRLPFVLLVLVGVGVLAACSGAPVEAQPAATQPGATQPAALSPEATQPDSPEAAVEEGRTIEEVNEAVAAFRNRQFDKAVELLTAAKTKHPELPPPRVFLARLFAATNNPMAARAALEQAVVESSDDPEAYLIIGEFALRERRFAEAWMMLREGAKLAATVQTTDARKKRLQQTAEAGLAAVAEARGNWEQAQRHLEAFLALDPQNAAVRIRLGRALFLQDKFAEAERQFEEAKKIDENVPASQAILAQLYEQKGDRAKAAENMAAALRAEPQDLQVRLAAARWSLETGQLNEAETHAKAAMAIDKESIEVRLISGLVALAKDDFAAAEGLFQGILVEAPNHFGAADALALALAEQEDTDKRRRAFEYAQANLRKHGNHPEGIATLGWVLYKMGRVDEAEQVLSRLFASGNISASAAYYLSRISLQRGRTEDAKKLLEAALNSRGMFLKRDDAQKLFDVLNR